MTVWTAVAVVGGLITAFLTLNAVLSAIDKRRVELTLLRLQAAILAGYGTVLVLQLVSFIGL